MHHDNRDQSHDIYGSCDWLKKVNRNAFIQPVSYKLWVTQLYSLYLNLYCFKHFYKLTFYYHLTHILCGKTALGRVGYAKNHLLPETKFVRVNLWPFLCPVWFKTHDFKLRLHPHPNSGLSVLIGCCSSPSSHLFYTFVEPMGGGTLQFKRGSPKLELPLCFLSHLLAHCCSFVTL